MEGKVVFEGKTKTGKDIIIRYAKDGDAPLMQEYINTLSKEQTYIRFQGEQVSLEEEEKYLKEQLEKMNKHKAVLLLVFYNDQLVGNSGVDLSDRVDAHVGVFGISVADGYRKDGIGSLLMDCVLQEAEKELPDLKIATLGVFSNNPFAKSMYERKGFKEYGNLPEGVLHKEQFVDHIYMYKKIR